ncbi:tetrahydrofolate dehydrogenase/cyclohydrolase catalytic domain-containing protein [Bacillus cereus]|uniref:tetrahydrofolate dehydrogenase/cyclohydrolase catalytic domain-containing protein n=1 Tax=Bacillus cereus TaxID=1396 RepID=UPI00384C10D8
MSATIIQGKEVQLPILQKLQTEVLELQKNNIVPGIAIIKVNGGELLTDTNFSLHVNLAKKLGYMVKEDVLPYSITEEELIKVIEKYNYDDSIHGIIVLIPLPDHINVVNVINSISPNKEIEGLHPYNASGLFPTSNSEINVPMCVPHAVLEVLSYYGISLEKANVVILMDWSFLSSNPIANMVARIGAVTILPSEAPIKIINTKTDNIKEHCKEADLLIVSTEQVDFVKEDWVKPGACVIDFNPVQVGIKESIVHPGKKLPVLKGGVDVESVQKVAKWVSPVAGGVGPVMLAMLMRNVLLSCKRKNFQMETSMQ